MGNLPDDLTDMELAEYFCEVGQVLSAQIRGSDGAHFGFVEFAYPEHVQHVLGLAEQQPFMLGDSYLRVQPRRPKEHHQVCPACRLCTLQAGLKARYVHGARKRRKRVISMCASLWFPKPPTLELYIASFWSCRELQHCVQALRSYTTIS